MITTDQESKILTLTQEGHSFSRISQETGISRYIIAALAALAGFDIDTRRSKKRLCIEDQVARGAGLARAAEQCGCSRAYPYLLRKEGKLKA